MKKKIVLVVLLILPIFLYIFFSLAKHNSLFLPVLHKNVSELPEGKSLNDSLVKLEGKITVLGFAGTDIAKKKESIFNLNQKINSKYKGFNDFQIVMLAPEGEQEEIKELIKEFSVTADISGWNFYFASPEDIKTFYTSLHAREQLNADTGSQYVFIIDKDRSLRGRDGKTGNKKQEYKDSYNSFSASDLHNEMTDDIKILLREYRLALKKNNNDNGLKRKI